MRWQLGPRNAECGTWKRKGFDHRFGEATGEALIRTLQQAIRRNTSGPRYFSAGRKTTLRPFAGYEVLLRFKTIAAAETKTRIAKKENYNGRLQQSH
jgi:hypothetical protein